MCDIFADCPECPEYLDCYIRTRMGKLPCVCDDCPNDLDKEVDHEKRTV